MNMRKLAIVLMMVFAGVIARGQPAQFNALPPMVQLLLMYEQLYNDRAENLKVFTTIMQNDVDPAHLPENQPVMDIDVVLVPIQDIQVIDTTGGQLATQMETVVNGQTYVPLFIHPESRNLYAEEIKKYAHVKGYVGTPTASHRSMIIWQKKDPKDVLFIKLSLDRKIGGDLRILTKGQIARAAAVSYLLKKMNMPALAHEGIYFIDEPFHAYVNSNNTGYTVRTMPHFPEGSEIMPMFALYSKSNGKIPIIAKLIKESGQDPKIYVRENLMKPLISHMMKLAFSEGLVGDPHEQNVVVRLQDGKLMPELYYRDLGGFDINPDLRLAAGKDMSFLPANVNPKYLKPESADVISKTITYVINSNLFAMAKALEDEYPEISKSWVTENGMKILEAEVYLQTGISAVTEATMKAAVTKYAHQSSGPIMMCREALAQ